jgi:hypothetical protein
MELQSHRPPLPGKMMLARATEPFWRYLLLESLLAEWSHSGPPGLGAGCVTDGGSLAGKLSASSRSRSSSSCFFSILLGLSRPRFLRSLAFVFWGVLVNGFVVMIMLLWRGLPQKNGHNRQLFPRLVGLAVWLKLSGYVIRLGCAPAGRPPRPKCPLAACS